MTDGEVGDNGLMWGEARTIKQIGTAVLPAIMVSVSAVILVLLTLTGLSVEETKKEKFNRCQKQAKATKGDVDSFRNHEIPTTPTGKCLLACILEGTGLMSRGRVSLTGVRKLAEQAYRGNAKKIDKARQVVDTCAKRVVGQTQRCEVAAALAECTTTVSEQLNL